MKNLHQYRGRIWHHNRVLDHFDTVDYQLAIARISRLLEEYSNAKGDIVDLATHKVIYRGRYSQAN